MENPLNKLKSVWNVFKKDPPVYYSNTVLSYGSLGNRPDRMSKRIQNERSVINNIFNRIAVDCSSIELRHVKYNENGSYKETVDDTLNRLLKLEANIDQTGRAFVLDLVYSILDEGCIAICPTDTIGDPMKTESYKVMRGRIAKVLDWYPHHVRLNVYDENSGVYRELVMEKRLVPIIQNPFYSIMNEPNSTLQRYLRLLNQLDSINSKAASGKMDLIIQLPYITKNKTKQDQAEERRKSIETQLTDSKYGVAYIDGTERVIQLNRPVENNLWAQAKELKEDLFNQMCITMSILNGTADDKTMLNYYTRVVEPIMSEIADEICRKWISRTAQTQGQGVMFFRDPFKMVPVLEMAEIGDAFTRNEIMTANELRAKMGMLPANDPRADQLINSNINQERANRGNPEESNDNNTSKDSNRLIRLAKKADEKKTA